MKHPPTRDLACNSGMCPDWESNQQLFGSQAQVQSTELHQPGLIIGDHSAWHGPSSHVERPLENEVQHTGPTPMDRVSRGESGLHCT